MIEKPLVAENNSKNIFLQILEVYPKFSASKNILKTCLIDTPLGNMIAIADDHSLCLLEFWNRRHLERKIKQFKMQTQSIIVAEDALPLKMIKEELSLYFSGKLETFKTPLSLLGTPFQKQVWHALIQIPFGKTCSYSDLAININKPTACRAVAQANGANRLAVIIPCHRVIQANKGGLGGYAGGLDRKQWLIENENRPLAKL